MASTHQQTILNRFYLAYGVGALVVYVLLMALVFPWWNAANHPVLLNLSADPGTNIELMFAEDEAPLPLVPVGPAEEVVRYWGTELPPRPHYDLALSFPEGTAGVVIFRGMEVVRLSPGQKTVSLGINAFVEGQTGGVELSVSTEGVLISAEPGSRIPLPLKVASASPYEWVMGALKATFTYVVIALIILLAIGSFLRFPDGLQAYRKRTPPVEILIFAACAVAGILVHLHLVRHSMPVFSPGESDPHVLQAMDRADATLSLEQASAASPVRPGYAWFLSKVGTRVDWNMGEVALYQAVLFGCAVTVLGLSAIRLVQGYYLGPLLFLILISPPALWASRHIGIQSVLASAWFAGTAAFLFSWQREGWLRWVGFVGLGLMTAWAMAISFVGVILLVMPVGLVTGTIWWCYSIRGYQFWKIRIFWRTLGQTAIPFACALIGSLFIWRSEGGSTACTPAGPFTAGVFDVRVIEDREDYAAFVNQRAASNYRYNPATFPADGMYDPEEAYAAVPWRARLTAWGRLTGWGLFLPDVETYARQPFLTDYTLRSRYRSTVEAEEVRSSLTEIMRLTDKPVYVNEKRSNRQVVVYNETVNTIYPWFYRILFFLALGGWLIALSERKYLVIVFITPYFLNIFLQIFTFRVGNETVQFLDACLWLTAFAGLICVNPKVLQKPTDEGDRRFMSLIRPKHLMTRYRKVPRIPQ